MKIKKVTDNILIVYTLTAFFSVIVGIILDDGFFLFLGAIIGIMGGLFVNNYHTRHITSILKQNNLWIDESFEKKKIDNIPPKKDGFD